MNSAQKYQLNEEISLTEVDEELVLLNLATGAYYGLNHVGARVIKALQDGQSVQESIQQISAHYQLDLHVVNADIEELMDQLVQQKLLVERV
ncbi:MAG: PqqD family protein [Pseudomonadota bacterium]